MEEKGTIHIHLLTELTGNLYSEESEWEEDWSESDEYGMPLDGTELADYEEVIREELKRYGKMISCSILMEVSPFRERYKVQLLR